jgi:hypothetical protein
MYGESMARYERLEPPEPTLVCDYCMDTLPSGLTCIAIPAHTARVLGFEFDAGLAFCTTACAAQWIRDQAAIIAEAVAVAGIIEGDAWEPATPLDTQQLITMERVARLAGLGAIR